MASADIDSELQDLPYSGVAFKASHNAYIAEKPPLAVQLAWDQGSPSRGACRGVELDLIQDADSWRWSVAHGGSYSNGAEDQLSSYLGQLRQWSLAQNQDHGPILVHLELKNTALADGQFPAAIDAYIGEALSGASLYAASTLLGDAHSLLAAARERHWPSLAALQGHFLFCITGGQVQRTATYLTTGPETRLCFCDRDINDILDSGAALNAADEPNRLFYNFAAVRSASLPARSGLPDGGSVILRAYEVQDWETWGNCRNRGVNVLATDQIMHAPFATVGPSPYAVAPGEGAG